MTTATVLLQKTPAPQCVRSEQYASRPSNPHLVGDLNVICVSKIMLSIGAWRSGMYVMQVAVIKWAGTEQQHVWHARICDVADKLNGEKLSPCIIVVGQVTQYASVASLG